MSRSNIEWTEATWNPVVGCTRVSPGCDNCYAVGMSHRLEAMAEQDRLAGRDPGRKADYIGLTVLNPRGDRHFNGQVRCVPERLGEPLAWRKPRMIFTASMSDIFHPSVPFEYLDRIFAVMAICPQHTFQVLTKRPERMAEYLTSTAWRRRNIDVYEAAAQIIDGDWDRMPAQMAHHRSSGEGWWPLPNVWLMTTVENQEEADRRIPHLLRCPAAVRGLSCEPLLGAVDLLKRGGVPHCDCSACSWRGHLRAPDLVEEYEHAVGGDGIAGRINGSAGARPAPECPMCGATADQGFDYYYGGVDWVIAGGETGASDKVRPTENAWLRSLRDQCRAAGVPFFLKQRTERGKKIPYEQWPADLQVREWPEAAS